MWKNVVDNWPEEYAPVLVTDGETIGMGYIAGTEWRWERAYRSRDSSSTEVGDITHYLEPIDLLTLPGLSLDTPNDVQECVLSVMEAVTQLEDEVAGIEAASDDDIVDIRGVTIVRLAQLVLLIANKVFPGVTTHDTR